jgi:hypothetical protein
VAAALALVVVVLATPLAYGAVRSRRLVARAALWPTLVGVVAAGAVAIAIAAIEPANSRGLLLAAGGIAWGALVAVTLPVLVPPLVGLGRIDYRELGPIVAAWAGLVIRRALVVAVFYAPIVVGLVLAGRDADAAVWLALVMPLGLLVARQWLRLVVAVLADRLDAALLDIGTDATAWHGAVRAYFVGYLRRNGLSIDDDLLDRVTVLPATGDQICVYGGGATHTRIAIPRRMLELALAPWGRPHDYAAPRVSTLHWSQWNAGLVMSFEAGATIATREQRRPREVTTEGDPSEHARDHFGEPPTLAGIIEPAALDPRTSYRPHDDPAWLDWDAGDDHDGTDAGDRDFLFGALVHAFAMVQRHADRPATLTLVLRRAGRHTARLGRLLERLSDGVGDAHAAIQGARHHLIQYLGWRAWQREDLLTARAYAPELEAMSRRVVAEREAALPGAGRARDRLAGLARFVDRTAPPFGGTADRGRAPLVDGASPQHRSWRRWAVAGAVAALAGGAALAVADAVRYHARYVDPASTVEPVAPNQLERPDHGKT